MPLLAVLTGDLVDSTRVAEPAAFRQRLSELVGVIAETFQAQTQLYRGDGFQVAIGPEVNAFRMAVLLRAGLICAGPDGRERWDARIAIAFGQGDFPPASQSSEAHVKSGRALDDLKKGRLWVHADDEVLRLATGTATAFADDILKQLTTAEAQALYYHVLEGGSHQDIATRLGKKRPTVTQALRRARYQLLDRYIEDMNRLVRKFHE
jgi:hypothetical protein